MHDSAGEFILQRNIITTFILIWAFLLVLIESKYSWDIQQQARHARNNFVGAVIIIPSLP